MVRVILPSLDHEHSRNTALTMGSLVLRDSLEMIDFSLSLSLLTMKGIAHITSAISRVISSDQSTFEMDEARGEKLLINLG